MPAPLRVCSFSGCYRLVPRGYCEKHRLNQRQPTDPRYGTNRWRLYSRQRLLEHPWCVLCHSLAQVTDHIVPVTEAPERFFDPDNHRSLCRACNRHAELEHHRIARAS